MKKDRDPLDILRSATKRVEKIAESVDCVLERKDALRVIELEALISTLSSFQERVSSELASLKSCFSKSSKPEVGPVESR